MSNALLETLENLRNLSHGPFETLERLGSLGNLSHDPLAKPWYFSHGPFETFFSAQAKVFVRKALPGDYSCFFLREGGWGGSSCYGSLELIPLIPILPGDWGIDNCRPPSMP